MAEELTVVKPQAQAVVLTQEAQQDVDGFRAIQYAAKLMAKSGCFADIKGVDEEQAIAKAVVKIAIGRDYGFSAAESMQYIELIQGRPSIAAHARAAKMKAAGYSWKFLKFDSTACNIEVYGKSGELLGDSTFSIEDAKRMGLAEKDNWKKNPRNMLYCRAISNAQRWYAPEVLSASLVSTEELMDDDRPARAEPFRASISIADVKPSEEPNRGHNATNPETAEAAKLIGMPKRKHPRNGIPVFEDFPEEKYLSDGQKLWVNDVLFQFVEGQGFMPIEEPVTA